MSEKEFDDTIGLVLENARKKADCIGIPDKTTPYCGTCGAYNLCSVTYLKGMIKK